MAYKIAPLLLLISALISGGISTYVEAVASVFDLTKAGPRPMVAFSCGLVNQHIDLESGNWTSDPLEPMAACPPSEEEVLRYCKQIYPSASITNVVKANEKEMISGWCKEGKKAPCKHQYQVYPHRCIVGSFESDALMVPEDCRFGHRHDVSLCLTHDKWHYEAKQACAQRSDLAAPFLKDYGMLLSCGVGRFRGVEYVCCPSLPPTTTATTTQAEDKEPVEDNETGFDLDPNDPYFLLDPNEETPKEEHNAFTAAKKRLEDHHKDRMSKLLKEWEEAENDYEKKKVKDPKGSEKMHKEMMERFQSTVNAMEDESAREREQLRETHVTRIEANLNNQKRTSMEEFASAIDEEPADAKYVMKTLKKFVRAEQKDRIHRLRHYQHLRQSNPKKAEGTRLELIKRLQEISQRVNQTVEMLKLRLPKIFLVLKPQIDDLFKTDDHEFLEYSSVLQPLMVTDKQQEQELGQDFNFTTPPAKQQGSSEETSKSDELTDDAIWDLIGVTEMMPTTLDPEDWEDESILELSTTEPKAPVLVKQHKEQHKLHSKDSSNFINTNDLKKTVHTQEKEELNGVVAPSTATVVSAIIAGVVALATAMVIAILIVRRKRSPVSQGFSPVSNPHMTMEQRHLSSMQRSGYENPTYKYFEVQ